MAPRSSIFSSDPLARTVATALACVVVFELIALALPDNALLRTWRWLRMHVANVPAANIEILGDSVAYSGFIAEDVERELPPDLRVANLAVQGGGPEFTWALLRGQIAAGHVPRAVVWAHIPARLTMPRTALAAGGFLKWSEIPVVLAAGAAPFDVLYGALCRVSYVLRHRSELRGLAMGRPAELRGLAEPIRTPEEMLAGQERDERRRIAGWTPPTEPLEDEQRQPFVLDPLERAMVARTLALCREHDVRVYWFTPLESPTVRALHDSLDFERGYIGWVDSLAATGAIVPLRAQPVVGAESDFKDHVHLWLHAARRESRMLGRAIARDVAETPESQARSATTIWRRAMPPSHQKRCSGCTSPR